MRVRGGIVPLLIGLSTCVGLRAGPVGAGGFVSCDDPLEHGRGTTVTIRRMCFRPAILRTRPGTEVVFSNEDGFEHDVVGSGWSWGSGRVLDQQDPAFRHRFDDAGIYPFACSIHPGMVGAVIVGIPPGASIAPAALDLPARAARGPSVAGSSGEGLGTWIAVTAGATVALLLVAVAVAARSRRRSPATGPAEG
jgi:plastocyanin